MLSCVMPSPVDFGLIFTGGGDGIGGAAGEDVRPVRCVRERWNGWP